MHMHTVHAALACLQSINASRALFATSLLCLNRVHTIVRSSTPASAAPAAPLAAVAAAAAPPPAGTPTHKKKRGRKQRRQQLQHLEQAQGQEETRGEEQQQQQHQRKARRIGSAWQRERPGGGGEDEEQQEAGGATPPDQQQQPDIYKFWTEDEAQRLVQCVEDAEYRREHLGSEDMDWSKVAAHFGRSVQAVRSKYRHEKIVQQGGMQPRAGRQPQEGGSSRKAITYGWMAIYALSTLPDREGTGDEVCAAVEGHPPFHSMLDRTLRPDSTGVPKWKQRIREELSHRSYFVRTGAKRDGQAVWRLNPSQFDSMPPAQRRRLKDLRLPGMPFLGRHGDQN